MSDLVGTGVRRWWREVRLRQRLHRELTAIGINTPMPMAEVCRRLQERSGKPIRLLAYPLEVPGAFGAWLSTPSADYILYQRETTPAHQEHIIAHELGHMLAGHSSDEFEDELWRELLPDIPAEHIRRALRRTHYDTEDERAAEMAATMLLERATTHRARTGRSSSQRAARAQRSLIDPQGWL